MRPCFWLPMICSGRALLAQDRNESLFFHVLSENIEELLPIVHMPTVSQYCQTYGLMFKSLPRSLFISIRDRGAHMGFVVARLHQSMPNAHEWQTHRCVLIGP